MLLTSVLPSTNSFIIHNYQHTIIQYGGVNYWGWYHRFLHWNHSGGWGRWIHPHLEDHRSRGKSLNSINQPPSPIRD